MKGVSKSSSGVVEVTCIAAVVVVGDQHFSVLVGPEAVEVDQDAGDGIALATVYQVLESDLIGVFRLHHVKDLILRREGEQNVHLISPRNRGPKFCTAWFNLLFTRKKCESVSDSSH